MTKPIFKIFRLRFIESLHLANERADYASSQTTLHSDTIYAAIYSTWGIMGRTDWLAAIEEQNGIPDFTLSSAFPYTSFGEVKKYYFLPRIQKGFDAEKGFDWVKHRKRIKKIEWIELETFVTHIQNPKGFSLQNDGKNIQEVYLMKDKDILKEDFIEKQIEAKVTVSRQHRDAEPYSIEKIRFKQGSGLYFMFLGSEESYKKVQKAMSILQEEGLGTDRSTGNGRFVLEELDQEEMSIFHNLWDKKADAKYFTNLSLLRPSTKNDLNDWIDETDKNIGWTWIKRGGWITTYPFGNYQKQPLLLFAEGGVFKIAQKEHFAYSVGSSFDVRPPKEIVKIPHPIWRVGYSLAVPIIF